MSFIEIQKENDGYLIKIVIVGLITIKAIATKRKPTFYELHKWQFVIDPNFRQQLYK